MRGKLLLFGMVIFVLLCSSLVVSVEAASMWSRTYGANGNGAYSVVETSDGGYAVVGSTRSSDDSFFGGNDFWLVKTDVLGNIEWCRTYGNLGTAYEVAYSVVVASDGGYVLAGFAATFPVDSLYYVNSSSWVVKTDAFGNMQWNRTYGGQSASSLAATSDGGYAMVVDSMLVKTDAFGNMQWNKTYGGHFVATSDGGYAIAGGSSLIKTDAFGNIEWNQTYGGTAYFSATSLVATSDGGYAIAGDTYSTVAGLNNWDFCLVKTDELGRLEWNQTYGGPDGEMSGIIVATSDGGYAIAGRHLSIGDIIVNNIWLVKTDAFGNMEWNQTYENTGYDQFRSLVKASDGGYVIAGFTYYPSDGIADFWVVKTDEFGVVPEYSSWLVPALVLTATAFIIINKKRLLNKRS